MKYCKICKTAAKDSETVCAKGHPLSTFGGRTTATATASPTTNPGPQAAGPSTPAPAAFALQGKLRELEDVRQRNLNFGRGLGLLSLLALLMILVVLYQVYARTVLDYAVLEDIRFEQGDIAENQITVHFNVKEPGKVVFDRRSGTGRTEKLDVINATEAHTTVWSWPSDPKTGIDFRVVSRGGWFRTSAEKHFNVTRNSLGVEVVFLMDITSSMGPYIAGLKRNCQEFAEKIRQQGIDCRLGLIGFPDVGIGEQMVVFEPTADIQQFEDHVASLELTGGGDSPESSVEALEKALEMTFRPHTRVCFIHITDADCHFPERIPNLAATLKTRGIVVYVISQGNRQLYEPLCVHGGSYLGLRDARFEEILSKVAQSLVNQIDSN